MGFKHSQNLSCSLQGRLIMNRTPFFLLHYNIQSFRHPEISKSSGVFLNRSATDFFLTYLASVSSIMVHIYNFLFITADEDAQHSSQVSRKDTQRSGQGLRCQPLITARQQFMSSLTSNESVSSHWQFEGSGCPHFTGSELSPPSFHAFSATT